MRRYAFHASKRYLLKALTHVQRQQAARCSSVAKQHEQNTPGNVHVALRKTTRDFQTKSHTAISPSATSDYHDVKPTCPEHHAEVAAATAAAAAAASVNEDTLSIDSSVKRSVVKTDTSAIVKPFSEMPGPKGIYTVPILGTLLHFKPFTNHTLRSIHELYGDLLKKYGPIVRVSFGQWVVLVEDPEDISVVFQNEGRYPNRPTAALHKVYCDRCNLAHGVAARENEDWLTLRRAMNTRMMKADSATKYLDIQNKVADDLVTRFCQIKFTPLQMRDEFFKYATESISALAFNKRLGFLDDDTETFLEKKKALENMRELFELFSDSFYDSFGLYKYFRTPFYKKYEKIANDVLGLTNSILDECLAEIKENEKNGRPQEDNFLLNMLAYEEISLEDIKVVVIDLFVAGTDSTAKNLQMLLYVLAKHPANQQRLYEEILSHVGTSGPLTENALNQMHYLKACVKEGFRIYHPTSTGTTRYLSEDIVLRGYTVPKDTLIMMCNHRTVKNERYFHHPNEFLPERWLRNKNGQRSNPIHPMAFLPFGFGPRSCLGRRFAEQEVYLAITKILQNFEVSLEPGEEEVKVEYTMFITTKDPIHFVLKKRDN